MEHQPPGTYILRELNDVSVSEPVSWLPQTIGWQILAGVIGLYTAYRLMKRCQYWWSNRYRREALTLIEQVKQPLLSRSVTLEERIQIGQDYFQIMKAQLVYLNPKLARQHSSGFLLSLDSFTQTPTFKEELGLKWMQSLLQKSKSLTQAELLELSVLCEGWIHIHRVPIASPEREVKKNG